MVVRRRRHDAATYARSLRPDSHGVPAQRRRHADARGAPGAGAARRGAHHLRLHVPLRRRAAGRGRAGVRCAGGLPRAAHPESHRLLGQPSPADDDAACGPGGRDLRLERLLRSARHGARRAGDLSLGRQRRPAPVDCLPLPARQPLRQPPGARAHAARLVSPLERARVARVRLPPASAAADGAQRQGQPDDPRQQQLHARVAAPGRRRRPPRARAARWRRHDALRALPDDT